MKIKDVKITKKIYEKLNNLIIKLAMLKYKYIIKFSYLEKNIKIPTSNSTSARTYCRVFG